MVNNDDEAIAEARYARLTFNAPLSLSHADTLLTHLDLTPATSVVDLGCGWGELLLRAAASVPSDSAEVTATFTGVDTDVTVLARARREVASQGLSPGKVTFVEQPAAAWTWTGTGTTTQPSRAICIGSSHAFGNTSSMLTHLTNLLSHPPEEDGHSPTITRALIGEMFWEEAAHHPNNPRAKTARAQFEDPDSNEENQIPSLAGLVEMCRAAGWTVLHLSVADQREWDEFESAHRAGLREWALLNGGRSPTRAEEVRREQDERERGYLEGYRGLLGFAYLVLGR
ncbi:SAM-dependent methyltransferase [Dichotomopilus funicola]|uniref:SAM-dependent methyltransferase n=1 Tax=Dichotomopilus funicola TaxID=1934379 RepID=A0AAN6ZMU4_9PEZI|nr:SAM-dependent methyltransferase [Dichotomopilus funicola]